MKHRIFLLLVIMLFSSLKAERRLQIEMVDKTEYANCQVIADTVDSLQFISTGITYTLALENIYAFRANANPHAALFILGGAGLGYFIATMGDYGADNFFEQLLMSLVEFKAKVIFTGIGLGVGSAVSLVRYSGLYVPFAEYDQVKRTETLEWIVTDFKYVPEPGGP